MCLGQVDRNASRNNADLRELGLTPPCQREIISGHRRKALLLRRLGSEHRSVGASSQELGQVANKRVAGIVLPDNTGLQIFAVAIGGQ